MKVTKQPAITCKGIRKKGTDTSFVADFVLSREIVFTYSKLKIESAISLEEIEEYFATEGATLSHNHIYRYRTLEIKVTPGYCQISPSLIVPRNRIDILSGEREQGEKFLTNFRMHFLSAGG